MATRKATLTVEITYNDSVTDPESISNALDQLMETALSTPDILEEYGNPEIGPFLVQLD